MNLSNKLRSLILLALILPVLVSFKEDPKKIGNKAEMLQKEGFVPLFNGKDLKGWKGLVGDPIKRSKMDAKTLAEAQKKADAEMRDSW